MHCGDAELGRDSRPLPSDHFEARNRGNDCCMVLMQQCKPQPRLPERPLDAKMSFLLPTL